MAREDRADSGPASDEGVMVTRRRERLGLTIGELAELAKVNRDTVSAIENGQGFRRDSLTKIEKALLAEEEEAGLAPIDGPAAPGEVEPQSRPVVINLDGGAVVVEGPIENLEALIAAAERLRRGASTGEE